MVILFLESEKKTIFIQEIYFVCYVLLFMIINTAQIYCV